MHSCCRFRFVPTRTIARPTKRCVRLLEALTLLLWLASVRSSAFADETFFVSFGSEWRFFRGLEEPTPESPAAWRSVDFDDAAWDVGAAPLGYGFDELGTDLNASEPPMEGNYLSLYVRQRFSLSELDRIESLEARVIADDGAIVWLNGTEIARINAPGDPGDHIPFDERAARAQLNRRAHIFPLEDFRDLIDEGANVLAAQGLNRSLTSNDMRLAIELVDRFGPDRTPPELAGVVPVPQTTTRTLQLVHVDFGEPVSGVDALDLLMNSAPALKVRSDPSGRHYRFLFAPPSPGAVELAWALDHLILDRAEIPNAFAGGSWSYRYAPDEPLPAVVISEVSAASGALRDENGDGADWIELQNVGDTLVDLAGYALSDDPERPDRWRLPTLRLEPGAFLLVLATGKDRADPAAELHASFKLDPDGDSVFLFSNDAPRQLVAALRDYPEQRGQLSYGRKRSGELSYFATPTPGSPNVEEDAIDGGFVSDPEFSVEHGHFEEAFSVELSCATTDAELFYTLDGSWPTPESARYSGPIEIDGEPRRGAAVLRATAFKSGMVASRTITRTFIFPTHVLTQPADPDGFPGTWRGAARTFYGMSAAIVNDPRNADLFPEALLALPSVSIVADVEDLFGGTGLYSNPTSSGIDWERPGSVELIDPTGEESFQVNCGLRIQGGASRGPSNSPKHSFRLLFKSDYGPSRLSFPLFGRSRVEEFDTLILRAGYNNSWIHSDTSQNRRATYLRDQWARDTLRDMGQPSARGRFVHLYLNGLYWGIYNLVERPSGPFAAAHLGGRREDWDALNSASPVDGDSAAWRQLTSDAQAATGEDKEYFAILDRLDETNFIDYMLTNYYCSNSDWPHHNWYAARRRVVGAGYRFFSWDAERILEGPNESAVGRNDSNSPGVISVRLRQHAEHRVRFGDRVQRHCFGGGALTAAAVAARLRRRADEVEAAIVAESARWGTFRRENVPLTYQESWLPELQRLFEDYFPVRLPALVRQLRSRDIYPQLDAPLFSKHGGEIPAASAPLSMALPEASPAIDVTIYFTLDGRDPRLAFTGEVSPSAMVYTGTFSVTAPTTVSARAFGLADAEATELTWSALTQATFLPAAAGPVEDVVVSEIMFHPRSSPSTSATDDYEFVELYNAGGDTVRLGGLEFSRGIRFRFAPDDFLAPGERAVIVAQVDTFQERYPGVPILGAYGGRLANDGETLTLSTADGSTIFSVDFDDEKFWPVAADGLGRSLVLEELDRSPSDPRAWRASTHRDGSPAAPEPPPSHGAVVINEVLHHAADRSGGAIELFNPTRFAVDLGGWFMSPSRRDEDDLRKFRIPLGTTLPAGGYLVFSDELFRSFDGDPDGFALEPRGGEIFLVAADSSGELDGYIDAVEFGPTPPGVSFGRVETSEGIEFTALERPSLSEVNAEPRAPEVAINEIHYHPVDGDDEFVELFNPGSTAVDLAGWELRGVSAPDGEPQFLFPPGAAVPPRSYLLVVPGDPEAYRSRHQIPTDAVVVGPYGGALSNGGERLALLKPLSDPAGAAEVVDSVRYDDRAPWPVAADGDGASLERVRSWRLGAEALNWTESADGPTPGRVNAAAPPIDPAGGLQLPGDATEDGLLNVSDPIRLIAHLFGGADVHAACGGSEGERARAALVDADGNGASDLGDVIYLLNYLFRQGPEHALGGRCVALRGCSATCVQ